MHTAPVKPLVHDMARQVLNTWKRCVEHPGIHPPITQTRMHAMKESLPRCKWIFLEKNAWCYVLCCSLF